MAIGSLEWQLLPLIVLLAMLHYVFAAIALRAASGRPLPLWEAMMAQYSATAANRLTPAGLGGAAVNVRYLSRSGVTAPVALATVAGLQVLGGLADILLIIGVLLVGHLTGSGTDSLVAAMGVRLSRLATGPPLYMLTAFVLVLLVLAFVRRRRRTNANADRTARPCAAFADAALTGGADILRKPHRLAVLMTSSASTTLVLACAFAGSVIAVPGAAQPDRAGTLICVYLLGAAAASAVPTPVGSMEAALIMALGAAHVTAPHALHAVLLFRLITYWAPVPIGVASSRVLWPASPRARNRAAAAPPRAEVEELA